jgi:AraC family transcriptional regulator
MIDYRERLTPVLRALEQDPDLSIEALASRACLSLYHFHRVFTAVVGRPGEMCRRLRMQRAAWQLCYTDASVTAIALGAGLGSSRRSPRRFVATMAAPRGRFAATRARTDTWIARKDTHGKGHSLMLKATHQQGATP